MSAAESRSFGRFVRRGVWLPFVVAAGTFVFAVISITGRPQRYVSVAKLRGSGDVINTLKDSALRHQALERVRALHPDLAEADVDVDVDVRVSPNEDTDIFNAAVIGSSQEYVKIFFDALLDEFKALQELNRERQRHLTEEPLAEDLAKSEAAVKAATEKLAAFQKTTNMALLSAQQSEQSEALKTLMTEKRTLLAAAAGANVSEAERNAEQQRLPILERELEAVNRQIVDAGGKEAEFRRLERNLELADKDRLEKAERMNKFKATAETADDVAVIERASTAVEDVQPWISTVLVACGGGFCGGGALLLAGAGLWVAAGRQKVVLPEVPTE